MSPAVFEKFRADWRRGRALKTLRLGERQYGEWDSKTDAGTMCAYYRFDPDGETLVMTFHEMWAKDEGRLVHEGRHGVQRANLTVQGARAFIDLAAGLAADAGFARLRFKGQRMRQRRESQQVVELDVARYRRRRGSAR